MKYLVQTAALVMATAWPAAAQHEGHQMAGATPLAAADASQCAGNAQEAKGATDAALKRLELARQTNDAAALRTAIDDLSGALGFIQARLETCMAMPAHDPATGAAAPKAPMMQADVTQPGPAASALSVPAQPAVDSMASMDHSKMGHAMPAPAQPARPAADSMAGMDHSKMGHSMPAASADSAEKQPDPVCKMKVDPKTAPKAEYQGKTYYFCGESDRQKFLANPAKYLKETRK